MSRWAIIRIPRRLRDAFDGPRIFRHGLDEGTARNIADEINAKAAEDRCTTQWIAMPEGSA